MTPSLLSIFLTNMIDLPWKTRIKINIYVPQYNCVNPAIKTSGSTLNISVNEFIAVINTSNEDDRPFKKYAEHDDSLVNNKPTFVVVIHGYKNIFQRKPYIQR